MYKIRVRCGGVDYGTLGSRSSASDQRCTHCTIQHGRCVICKEGMADSYGLAFDYLLPGLRYSDDEVLRLKKRNTKCLLRKRKLHLVLDLDHTLLHSRKVKKLATEEKYLNQKVDSLENISKGSLFKLDDDGFLVKLRPYVRTFLEEASNLFEIYVCTMGSRCYSKRVAKFLDPDSKYFNSRIIAREDFKERDRKDVNLVLGQESGIVALDDTESVWSGHSENLIQVGKYDYFKESKDDKSYSVEKTDESENNGALANILRVLKTLHWMFFDNPTNINSGDVRSYLAKIRGGILGGCTLLFSDVKEFPLIWSRAEEMGATCTIVIDSSVTHVVSSNTDTEDCWWAVQEKKHLVHPRWIDAAYFLWRRQPEDAYLP